MQLNITLILEIVTFFILLLLLNKFVFKAVVNMLDARKQHIEKNLDDIQRLKKEASLEKDEAAKILLQTKKTALQIKDEALAYGQKIKEIKANEAEEEAQRIRDKAKEDLDLYLGKVKEELKRYSCELSFEIAEKILAQEVDRKKHKDLVEDCLKSLHEQRNNYF